MKFFSYRSSVGAFFLAFRSNRFGRMLDDCGLIVLEFFAPIFTWQRPCRGGRLVSKRLDMCVCDVTGRLFFRKLH